MFALICKRSFLLPNRVRISTNLITHLRVLQLYAPKTSYATESEHSFRVNYLVNSCSLSFESANSVAKKVRFVTPERPDAVLDILKCHGFTSEQITRVIRARPEVLRMDAKKTLLPKLEFFHSKQVSNSDVVMVIAGQPSFLCMSVKDTLVPCYDCLKSVLLKDERVFNLMKRSRYQLSLFNVEKILGPNLSLMRKIGLRESYISLLLHRSPHLFGQKPEKVNNIIRKVLTLGFNPSQATFVGAVEMVYHLKESTWERKKEVFRNWGWSDDEFWAAFRRYPMLISFSDDKISNTMDFFVNKMGLKTSTIAKSPYVLVFSLEKRIIPRCLVVKILLLNGLVGEGGLYIPSILTLSEKRFLDKFVIKHQEQVPQLMSIFLGEVGLQELGSRNGKMFKYLEQAPYSPTN